MVRFDGYQCVVLLLVELAALTVLFVQLHFLSWVSPGQKLVMFHRQSERICQIQYQISGRRKFHTQVV